MSRVFDIGVWYQQKVDKKGENTYQLTSDEDPVKGLCQDYGLPKDSENKGYEEYSAKNDQVLGVSVWVYDLVIVERNYNVYIK